MFYRDMISLLVIFMIYFINFKLISKQMHYCEHFRAVVSPKVPSISKNVCRSCNVGPPFVWMCLAKGCGYILCENNKLKHMSDHEIQFKNNHCIFINVESAEIKCVICKIEIYDIDQLDPIEYEKYKHCIDPYLLRMKYLPKAVEESRYESTIDIIGEDFGQLENSQAHKKSRRGLCGLFEKRNHVLITSVIQFLSNIPYYKHILKHCKLDSIKGENTKFLISLSTVIKKIWAGESRAIMVHQLTKFFFQRYPKLRGYKRKDPYDLFTFILDSLHQEFKFYEIKEGSEIIKKEIDDEWKILQELGKTYQQISIIKNPINSQLEYTVFCKKCKDTRKLTQQFMTLDLELSKTKRQIKEIQIEFNKRKYESPFTKRRRSLIDKILGIAQQEPPITLLELIINYTNNPKNIQHNKQCEKCSQQYQLKESKFNILPKILLIKINRLMKDGYNIDMGEVDYPNDIINLKGFVRQNYENNVVYQFTSAICLNKDKQYITIAKNSKNKQKYQFKNQMVKLTNQKYTPYLLCYIIKNKHSTLYHNIKSNVKLDISPQIPLPEFWLEQLKNFQPMPLLNPKICKHNKIKPRVESKIIKISYVPNEIFEALLQKFGGRQFQNAECTTCYKQLYGIALRKKKEKEAIAKFDGFKCKAHCMLSTFWLTKWTEYLYKKKEYNYFIKPLSIPGPVDNTVLLQNHNKLRPNLKKGDDFKVISLYVWLFFKQLYKGGPQIQYKTKGEDKNKLIQTYCQPELVKQIMQKVKQLKQYLSEQFFSKIQLEENSSIKFGKTNSVCSDPDLFKSKEFI